MFSIGKTFLTHFLEILSLWKEKYKRKSYNDSALSIVNVNTVFSNTTSGSRIWIWT